jgi:hypothetical protein
MSQESTPETSRKYKKGAIREGIKYQDKGMGQI